MSILSWLYGPKKEEVKVDFTNRSEHPVTIADSVLEFINGKLSSTNNEFVSVDLFNFVREHSKFYPAPGSTDRIMRKLRKQGKINYIVVNREEGLYRAVPVEAEVQG